MRAVILAGGLGLRLRSLVRDRPKPMAEVCGRPFLQYVLGCVKRWGVREVVLCVSYMAERIMEFFGDGRDFGVDIRYSVEEKPLGTGGAVKEALKLFDDKRFLVLNGDTLLDTDISPLLSGCGQAAITMALVRGVGDRYGSVVLSEEGYVLEFTEKGRSFGGYVNGGLYVVERSLVPWDEFPVVFSLEVDLLPYLVGKRLVRGVPLDCYFIDIGVPEDLRRFKRDVEDGKIRIW